MTSAIEAAIAKKNGKLCDPFGDRSERSKRHITAVALSTLTYLAGGKDRVPALLESVMGHAGLPRVGKGCDNKGEAVLKNIGKALRNLGPGQHSTRHCLLHLVAGQYSRRELISRFGFRNVGWRAWKTARRILRTSGLTGRIQKPRQGRMII